MKVQPITTRETTIDNNEATSVSNLYQLTPWFEEKIVNDSTGIEQQISLLSQRFSESHKWVLVISSDSHAFDDFYKSTTHNSHHYGDKRISQHSANTLTQAKMKTPNVLWVHANKVNVAHTNIEKALTKGNCAAVVLINAQLNTEQQAQLQDLAHLGKTHCVLLRH
ncbi:hypothetical protein [Thalassotalea euphylliae]|uniref:Uncharacterized protein n=1 Tax=Thalassotalea euphylliae TaxID=1655234 RepID=A0A3E0UEX6_9GAMM|nr:hypothetical protein [Thalassotalea euphylliae]REL35439.1 hypothetical protein DXX92_08790 [Thalassotalea euphylliae]